MINGEWCNLRWQVQIFMQPTAVSDFLLPVWSFQQWFSGKWLYSHFCSASLSPWTRTRTCVSQTSWQGKYKVKVGSTPWGWTRSPFSKLVSNTKMFAKVKDAFTMFKTKFTTMGEVKALYWHHNGGKGNWAHWCHDLEKHALFPLPSSKGSSSSKPEKVTSLKFQKISGEMEYTSYISTKKT